MKTILVPIELSRHGGNDSVLAVAQTMAKSMDAEIVLLYVIEQIPNFVSVQLPEGLREEQMQEAKSELEKLAAQFECSNAVIREGQPATEILEYASENKVDLIVLQSHDPNFSTYLIGSVASRVVRHAHCSVHVVREAQTE